MTEQISPNPLFPGREFISTILDALQTKQQMSGTMRRRYLQRAAMAGMIVGLMYLSYFAVVAVFTAIPAGSTNLSGIGKLVGSLVFGFALVFIYYTKSELLTSNMMIVSIGMYHRGTSALKALRLLAFCYLGNFVGGLVIAVLVRGTTLLDGSVRDTLIATSEHKLSYLSQGAFGWGDLFVRAIFCNFLINLAMLLVYNGLIHDDFTKSIVMIMSVFLFAFQGFEHSVANTVVFTMAGLYGHLDVLDAVGNVVIVLLGNYVGGGVLIGLYYAYVNDERVRGRRAA